MKRLNLKIKLPFIPDKDRDKRKGQPAAHRGRERVTPPPPSEREADGTVLPMKNLTEDLQCDCTIDLELGRARVGVIKGGSGRGEAPSRFVGSGRTMITYLIKANIDGRSRQARYAPLEAPARDPSGLGSSRRVRRAAVPR
jgi:hypothetical protein